MAYGFLEWYESTQSDKALYAPLILQPIKIERKSYRGHWKYYVQNTDDETVINITLLERMKQDYSLDLPELCEDENPEIYFRKVEDIIRSHQRWRIRRFVTFGLFSFGRLVMWHDLDPTRWPSRTTPSTNSVVATMLAGGAGNDILPSPEYPVDEPEWERKIPPIIRPADSSQLSSILDALEGKNLAIHGPPGTGKSQTITNLIAAALNQGKRVLFLAEKMAALEVVKSRLDEAELGHFVLELHSTKANKKRS